MKFLQKAKLYREKAEQCLHRAWGLELKLMANGHKGTFGIHGSVIKLDCDGAQLPKFFQAH